MRSLDRNKQKIFYALYEGKEDIRDELGNLIGEPVLRYGNPVEYFINVSAARGTADVDLFGINTNYTKTMVTNDLSCPIDETTRLWINRGTDKAHNYVVVSVARSINSITYAIKEVSVT